jgi:hypothetical protein
LQGIDHAAISQSDRLPLQGFRDRPYDRLAPGRGGENPSTRKELPLGGRLLQGRPTASHAAPNDATSCPIVAEVPARAGHPLLDPLASPRCCYYMKAFPSSRRSQRRSTARHHQPTPAGRPSTCSRGRVQAPSPPRPQPVRRFLPVAAPELAASFPPTPTEYGLDTNNTHVAVVPLAVTGVFQAVPTPTVFTPTVQFQQLYAHSELFSPKFLSAHHKKCPRASSGPAMAVV